MAAQPGMRAACKSILTINGGSSSIKFALFEANRSLRERLTGEIERIGSPDAVLSVHRSAWGTAYTQPLAATGYQGATLALLDWAAQHEEEIGLVAVGHRVVHGGPDCHAPQRVSPRLADALRALVPLDPEHLPGEIALIEAFGRRFSDLPQVACFDTAFHHALPRVAQLLPIPRRYDALGLRRYGFHGLSYEFLMGELLRAEGAAVAHGRVILAHLGNGASLAAVRDGQPVDTSMGLTPAGGVMMGTRTGDLDPGLGGYLARTEGLDAEGFNHMVNFESGLLGLSETSADMRDLLGVETQDVRAAEAVALFCHQVTKSIGAFAAALGGLDALVFAGGIGEHAPVIRARICSALGFLGIDLDAPRNDANVGLISTDAGRVRVRVMRTNEALVIARATRQLLGLDHADDASPP